MQFVIKKVPLKYKGKFYHITTKLAMLLYETKGWVVKSQQENKSSVA